MHIAIVAIISLLLSILLEFLSSTIPTDFFLM